MDAPGLSVFEDIPGLVPLRIDQHRCYHAAGSNRKIYCEDCG
jgi:hypothetical protein